MIYLCKTISQNNGLVATSEVMETNWSDDKDLKKSNKRDFIRNCGVTLAQ